MKIATSLVLLSLCPRLLDVSYFEFLRHRYMWPGVGDNCPSPCTNPSIFGGTRSLIAGGEVLSSLQY
jgi:hypothetical protein